MSAKFYQGPAPQWAGQMFPGVQQGQQDLFGQQGPPAPVQWSPQFGGVQGGDMSQGMFPQQNAQIQSFGLEQHDILPHDDPNNHPGFIDFLKTQDPFELGTRLAIFSRSMYDPQNAMQWGMALLQHRQQNQARLDQIEARNKMEQVQKKETSDRQKEMEVFKRRQMRVGQLVGKARNAGVITQFQDQFGQIPPEMWDDNTIQTAEEMIQKEGDRTKSESEMDQLRKAVSKGLTTPDVAYRRWQAKWKQNLGENPDFKGDLDSIQAARIEALKMKQDIDRATIKDKQTRATLQARLTPDVKQEITNITNNIELDEGQIKEKLDVLADFDKLLAYQLANGYPDQNTARAALKQEINDLLVNRQKNQDRVVTRAGGKPSGSIPPLQTQDREPTPATSKPTEPKAGITLEDVKRKLAGK